MPLLKPEVSFERVGNHIFVNTGKLYEQTSVFLVPLGRKEQHRLNEGAALAEIGEREFHQSLYYALRAALVDINSAARLESSLFSSSRLDVLAIKSLEAAVPHLHDLDVWEQARSVDVPWVRRLSAGEIVTLRDRASAALPRFREKMLGLLAKPDLTGCDVKEAVAELRADAAEVDAELNALNVGRGTKFRSVAGTLATTISVYGFAADFASAAVWPWVRSRS